MLLDLWEWFLLISDGIDLVFSNLASGTYPIPLSFLLVTFVFAFISFFAWRSTDIPDLPPAPRPPYVIQITAGPSGSGGSRQSISDVRLLSGAAFFDRSEILSAYPSLSRNQATNTDRPGTSTSATGTSGTVRNAGGRQIDANGQPVRRRSLGRSFLLGLFRRPNFPRPVPVPSVNAIRANLSSPNVVVYHRVNVYHHHIHSHVGPNQNPSGASVNPPEGGASPSNQADNNPSQNQVSHSNSTPSSNSTGQEGQSLTSSLNSTESSTLLNSAPEPSSTSPPPETSRLNPGLSEENHGNISSDANNSGGSIDGLTNATFLSTTSPVQINRSEDSSVDEPKANMPARSSGNQNDGGSGSSPPSASQQRHHANSNDAGADDVHFTIKFLNDTQMDVTSHLGEKIVDFKRRHFATEMSENKTVRLIFNGRVLDNDNKTLRESGIFEQCVVHCLIVNRQQQDPNRNNSGAGVSGAGGIGGGGRGSNEAQPGGGNRRGVGLPEPGMFFVAFIGIFLVFLWFICLHFGQHLFTQSAVVSLTVLTAIFLIGIVACYLPLPAN